MNQPNKRPSLRDLLLNIMPWLKADHPSIQSNSQTMLPPRPPMDDHMVWCVYWRAKGQLWRTEPEINSERQEYLATRRAITPDIQRGIYPFKSIKLNRADVEWLLITHEDGLGPVYWDNPNHQGRYGLDLRGADLSGEDLQHLPLSRLQGGLTGDDWLCSTPEQDRMAAVRMEETVLIQANLEGAKLNNAYLQGANFFRAWLQEAELSYADLEEAFLNESSLEGANFKGANLERTNMRGADLAQANLSKVKLGGADLEKVILSKERQVGPYLGDILWGDVNLAVVKWSLVKMLGDEYEARHKQRNGRIKDQTTRLEEYWQAIRANRQLAVALQAQGLNEDASYFAYRAQVLQQRTFRFQMFQSGISIWSRMRALSAWLFSWFLFLVAGYGYRLWHSLATYIVVNAIFAFWYWWFDPCLGWLGAVVVSMLSFHGRGFVSSTFSPGDPTSIVSALEAFFGLVVEVTLIATLTRRFFNR